ncbi:MAG: hypothetical protein HY064_04660 [Bacteroidetes bacterium]|nr:hypothetical protein [Bacteroidota bacterium]
MKKIICICMILIFTLSCKKEVEFWGDKVVYHKWKFLYSSRYIPSQGMQILTSPDTYELEFRNDGSFLFYRNSKVLRKGKMIDPEFRSYGYDSLSHSYNEGLGFWTKNKEKFGVGFHSKTTDFDTLQAINMFPFVDTNLGAYFTNYFIRE